MDHLTEYEIIDYLSGELTEQSRMESEKHLEECQKCRDKAAEYNRVINGAVSVFPREPEEIFWINYLPNLHTRMSESPTREAGFLHQLTATLTGNLVVLLTIIMFSGGFQTDTLELNFETWLADKFYEPLYLEANLEIEKEKFFDEFDLEYLESSSYYQESYLELLDEITYEQLEAAIEAIAEEKII